MFGSRFGGFITDPFGNDPFFSDIQATHRQHMQSMQSMFSADPFMSSMFPSAREDGGLGRSRRVQAITQNPMAISPFGMMNSMFANMNAMMGNMQHNMADMANDPNSHCYSSSTVMSYSNTGDGPPKYYQASSSMRQAPGGVRETRKTIRDSHRGVDKMAIGHHIGDRGHIIEKSRQTRTGDVEEKQDFLNIDESDAQEFDQEWKLKTGAGAHRGAGRSLAGDRSRPSLSAITDGREYQRDRDLRPTRLHNDTDRSVRFDRSERSSNDAQPIQRRPTPARPRGPSKGGRQRDSKEI